MITENEKLLIRELSENDVNVIFEIYSDKEAMKYRGSKPFENIEEAYIMIDKVIENIKNGKEYRYAIVEKLSNELIGTFLITPITNKNCLIGCSIGKKNWRLGYGLEVMTLMSEYLANLKYKKIIGLIKKENIPSIRLVEKMQFKLIEQKKYPEFFKYEKNLNKSNQRSSLRKDNENFKMNSNIRIVPFKDLYQQEIELLIEAIGKEFSEPITTKSTNKKNFPPDLYLVAVIEKKVVGTISITRLENSNSVLRKMFLHENYRGQGIAELLLRNIINWCFGNNVNAIYLGTMTQFSRAQKFYEKHNFQTISIEQLPKDFPINPLDKLFYKHSLVHAI